MADNLDKKILSTVCYYDVFDYPLTSFEIYKHIVEIKSDNERREDESISIADVWERMRESGLGRFIERKNGMYFLRGREDLVGQRIERDKISVAKIKKLRKVVYFLRLVPFVRMIAVTGRLAMKNAKMDSDWDVLVAVKGGRIWMGRTLITLVCHCLGKRRHHNKTKDRVCLNYFITADSLEIRNKDLFSANEYFFCIPIFDAGKYFKKFQLRNRWIRRYKPNYYLSESGNMKAVDDPYAVKFLRKLMEKILDWNRLEDFLGKIELKKIENNPNTKKEDGLIAADRKALIFLPEPQGPGVFEEFKRRINGLAPD